MTIVDYSYEHLLFYDDYGKAKAALAHVLRKFDASAEIAELSELSSPTDGHPYAVSFATEEELTQQEAHVLLQAVAPCEYDFNWDPGDGDDWDDDETP